MDTQAEFRVGDWIVHPREGRIEHVTQREIRQVRRKAMDVLCVLASRAGQLVERDDLLAAVWGENAVTDEPLTSTIAELRRLLRDGSDRHYIETLPKRGYKISATVTAVRPEHDSATQHDHANRKRPLVRVTRASVVALILVTVASIGLALFLQRTAPDTTPPQSVAVLPFDDLSQNADQAYLADGLAEVLISTLTRLPELRVAARSSAFAFRSQDMELREIAERLKVAHILSGSVQVSDETMRVTVQLVDAIAGYQVWSARYDRPLADIFAVQEDIATEVTEQLRLKLLEGLPQPPFTTTPAYALYLQARYIGRQHTQDSFERAAALYKQALAIDAEYAPAWSDLAGLYVNMVGFGLIPRVEGYRLANEAAYKALAIDPNHAAAHDRLGWIALHADANLSAAAQHYNRALALAPSDDDVQSDAAVLAVALGRLDDAIALFESVTVSDPVSPVSHSNLANAYLLARRNAEAEQSIRNALTLSPQYAAGHYRLFRALIARGDVSGAAAAIEQEVFDPAKWIGLAMLYNSRNDIAASDAELDKVLAAYGDAAAGNVAQVYAHRGDIDQAFKWLEVEYRENGFAGFLEYRSDPVFDSLRLDARWPALLARIGLSDADVAAIPFAVNSQNHRDF